MFPRHTMKSQFIVRFVCVGLALVTVSGCSRNVENLKREYLARGDRFFEEKKVDAAIIEYRNAIQQDARFGEAYRKLSTAYLVQGDAAASLRAAVTAADLLPEVADAQIEAGTLMLLAGKFAEAQNYATRAMAKAGNSARARVLAANAMAGLKDVDSAIKEYEEALRLDPQQSGIYTGLANLKAGKGERDAAEQMFKEAIAIEPGSVPARLALAQFYWASDRVSAAEQVMKEALQTAPQDSRANVALGIFYQATRRQAEAEPYLRAAAGGGKEPRLTMMLADYYLATNRSAQAATVLEPLASDRRYGALAGLRLAGIAQANGKADDALMLIDRAIAADPKNARTAAAKSELLRQQNKLDAAAQTVEAAVAANPNSVDVHMVRGRILTARGKYEEAGKAFEEVLRLNPRVASARLELARLSVRSGSREAVATAKDAAAADPRSLDARLTLARALTQQRDFRQAQNILDDLVRQVPSVAAVHAQLGTLLLATKEPVPARAAFERALSIDPMHLEALRGITAVDFAQGRRAEALARLDSLLASSPNHTGVMLIAATARASAQEFAEAERLLTRLIEIDPAALTAYSLLGRIYLGQKRLDAARAQFERLATRQERPVAAVTLIGTIDLIQNRTSDAQQAFERVIKLDPKAGVAANNLAWIYLENGGSVELALHLAQTASTVLPEVAEVHDTLGWAYYKKGSMPAAIDALRRSVGLDGTNTTALYHLILAYEKSGAVADAREVMTRYLKVDPSSERSAELRRRLQAIGT
jgi:tetratricopeptide (TPR) repeat protein